MGLSAGHFVRLLTTDGQVRTIAGSGRDALEDGVGRAASFSVPKGLAREASGALIVADAGNGVLRRIALDGTVSTLPLPVPDDATVSTHFAIHGTMVAVAADDRVYVFPLPR